MHNKPDIALIRRYVRGELSPQEMFEIERAAEADELLMDVLIGMEAEYAQGVNAEALPELQQQIQKRSKPRPRPVQPLYYRWVGLAASLLLVLGISMYVFLEPERAEQQLTQNTAEEAPYEQDTVPSPSSSSEMSIAGIDKKPVRPSSNQEKTLAYSKVEAPTAARQKNKTASRPAALDTIPIQIIPSNTEELVSRSLFDEHQALIAGDHTTAYSKTSARAAQTILPGQQMVTGLQPIALEDVKSITTGIVIDGETQRPISGATIRDLQMKVLVKTDSTGRFIVGSNSEKPVLNVQSAGFESADHVANGAMRIALKRKQGSKSATTLNSSVPKDKSENSRPEMGLKAYRLHIDSLAKASGLGVGDVTLLFSINAQGKPINIRLKKSSGNRRQDEEAIRILKNGPNWIKGRKDELVEWKIQF
ncbi:TonB family protein [Sphingobacterium sp. lm-10]|uniref:TonB family protein n=1 Tax=Sphingobacterium sp. lm-10 TaxID=2944904 RepID=UPI002021E288|nr:TonB family protein [Sphingobacterium sp. lm-10]MCL7987938.1 TonB family protein [Sphingobacterium sp. lm-10]